MFELYINDKIIDLPEESEQIGLEYAIMSIEDIGGRTGAKSYEYSVPKTDINLQAIGFNTELPNTSKFPYTRLNARAYEDGVDLNIRFAELTSINETINFRLYGTNSDFYSLVKDLKLTDLDLSDLNHFWDDQTMKIGLLKNTGYQYPIIEYKSKPDDDTDKPIKSYDMYPSLFYEEILQRFCAQIGYQLSNDVSGYYSDKLILPYSGADFKRNTDGSRYVTKVSRSAGYSVNAYGVDKYYVKWDTLEKPTDYFRANKHNWRADLADGSRNYGTCIEFADRVKVGGRLHLIIRNEGLWTMRFRVSVFTRKGADIFSPQTDIEFRYVTLSAINTANDTATINIPFGLITEPDDFDFLAVRIEQLDAVTLDPVNFQIKAGSYLDIASCEVLDAREITYNDFQSKSFVYAGTVNVLTNGMKSSYGCPSVFDNYSDSNRNFITVNSIFGDISFADLLKNYCLAFGLLPIADNNKKTLRLFRFQNFKKNIHKAKDWTNKIDYTTPDELTFIDDKYGQRSWFKWQIDTYPNDNTNLSIEEDPGANDYLDLSNENLELQKDLVSLDFAATITTPRFNKDVCWIGIKDGDSYSAKTQRLLFTKLRYDVDHPVHIEYYPSDDLTRNPTYIPYFSDALHFTNLREAHYSLIDAVIKNYKKLRISLRLTASDINQLDFTAPVYLQQFESYFYISKVEDYKPSTRDSCIVELVKLNING